MALLFSAVTVIYSPAPSRVLYRCLRTPFLSDGVLEVRLVCLRIIVIGEGVAEVAIRVDVLLTVNLRHHRTFLYRRDKHGRLIYGHLRLHLRLPWLRRLRLREVVIDFALLRAIPHANLHITPLLPVAHRCVALEVDATVAGGGAAVDVASVGHAPRLADVLAVLDVAAITFNRTESVHLAHLVAGRHVTVVLPQVLGVIADAVHAHATTGADGDLRIAFTVANEDAAVAGHPRTPALLAGSGGAKAAHALLAFRARRGPGKALLRLQRRAAAIIVGRRLYVVLHLLPLVRVTAAFHRATPTPHHHHLLLLSVDALLIVRVVPVRGVRWHHRLLVPIALPTSITLVAGITLIADVALVTGIALIVTTVEHGCAC
jgi:hypothetical protein